jgi:hypothetical protein
VSPTTFSFLREIYRKIRFSNQKEKKKRDLETRVE